MDINEAQKLNAELLRADEDENRTSPERPKRNSKEDLMQKIHKVVDQYELEFQYSDTKLKRMTKQDLTELLARQVEQGVQRDMARSVGVDPRGGGKSIGLGALRMMHNLAASGFETGFNTFGPGTVGYRMNGFTTALQDPVCQQSIDECLTEIAMESPEILEYFESAWARLGLVWMGAALTCMRKKSGSNINATGLGPLTHRRSSSGGASGSRGAPVRKVDSNLPPRVPNVRQI